MKGRNLVTLSAVLSSVFFIHCALHKGPEISYLPRVPHEYLAPQKFTDVNGMRISYIEMGSGAPVIFVHGLAGCADNFDPLITDLSRDYRCLVLDLPGYGNSEAGPHLDYSISLFSATVVGFMDALGIEKAVVLGHSMGGQTATYIGIHYPERVEKLILVAAAGAGSRRWYEGALKSLPLERMILSALRHVRRRMIGKTHEERVLYLKNLPVNFIVNRLSHIEEEGRPDPFMDPTWEYYADFIMTEEIEDFIHAVVQSMAAIESTDLSADMHRIRAPTLLVWGALDMGVPMEDAMVFNREIEGSMLVTIKGCYHSVQIDCADTVIPAIRSFLSMD